MIIPIRCFTCGKVIAHKWETYKEYVKNDMSIKDALDNIGMKRYCCRRMFMTHVDLIDKVLQYEAPQNIPQIKIIR